MPSTKYVHVRLSNPLFDQAVSTAHEMPFRVLQGNLGPRLTCLPCFPYSFFCVVRLGRCAAAPEYVECFGVL